MHSPSEHPPHAVRATRGDREYRRAGATWLLALGALGEEGMFQGLGSPQDLRHPGLWATSAPGPRALGPGPQSERGALYLT